MVENFIAAFFGDEENIKKAKVAPRRQLNLKTPSFSAMEILFLVIALIAFWCYDRFNFRHSIVDMITIPYAIFDQKLSCKVCLLILHKGNS
jgi:hypothetical protein